MLRAIRDGYIRPRLMAFRLNSTSGTPLAVTNGDNLSSLTDNGAGDATLNFTDPYQRQPILVATAGVDVGAGAIAGLTASGLAVGTVRIVSSTSAGTATDGFINAIVLGYDSSTTDKITPNYSTVRSPVPGGRILTFSVDGTGTASIVSGYSQATLTDNGTGDYTLTFARAFAEAPAIIGTIYGATSGVVNFVSTSTTSINVKTHNAAGALTDLLFDLIVVGRDNGDTVRVPPRTLHAARRLPRLMAFEVLVSGGTPTITAGLGNERMTISDDGTGLFTLTFTNAFLGVPQVVLTGNGSSIVNVKTKSASAIQVLTADNSGSAADITTIHGFILGYDDATEY